MFLRHNLSVFLQILLNKLIFLRQFLFFKCCNCFFVLVNRVRFGPKFMSNFLILYRAFSYLCISAYLLDVCQNTDILS